MKILKKIGVLLAAAALTFGAGVMSVSAEIESGYNTAGEYIYDYSDMLSDEEISSIDSAIEKTSENTGMNICVVINNNVTGGEYDYQDYADVFYEQIYGINTDGVCLFIRFDPNYVHFSTSGKKGQKYFNSKTDPILDHMTSDLRAKNISGAVDDMCRDLEKYTRAGKYAWLRYSLTGLVIGLIVGVIIIFAVRRRYKRHAVSGSNQYIDQKNTVFKEKNDVFIRQYTSRTRISSSSSGGGGGGSHTSSGGGSHGGGGRSF